MSFARFRLCAAGVWRLTYPAVALFVLAAPPALGAQGSAPASAVDGALRPRTIVVVPFANISRELTLDWLGTGIAETVTADLEQFRDLSVIGREGLAGDLSDAAPTSPDDETSAREVARARGISWLVSGGFQSVGDQLRITARIVDVKTGVTHATVKVDGRLDDVFALQDRIVAELAPGFAEISGAPAPVSADNAANATNERADVPLTEGPTVATQGEGVTADTERAFSPRGSAGPISPAGRRGQRPAAGVDGAASPANLPEGVTAPAQGRRGNGSPSASPPARNVTGTLGIGGAPPQLGAAGEAGALTGRAGVRPPRTQVAPAVDGRLDDAVWQDATRITEFIQMQPLDGSPATEATDVYVAYDSSNIYLAFYAHYQDPGIMRANRTDRDQAAQRDDTFSVYFDPFLDQQRAYVFSVNGYGVQGDSILGSRGGGGGFGGGRGGGGGGRGGPRGAPRGDDSWDALFSSGGQIVEDGFTAEMAIPFKSLRYPARGGDIPHSWGFQVVRNIRGKDETVVWSPVSLDVAGFLPQMGVLEGMTGLSTSRNLELQPTFTAFQFGTLNTDTGRVNVGDAQPEGGVGIKYGVTSNLTADFTLNPDFSQIESDRPQIEVNQRFAIRYPELRPFFLEGAEIFQIPGPFTTVHTRTIVDPLYGAKLTGKAGKTTVGMLYANDKVPGNVDDLLDPAFGKSAQTFVGRVRYDLYSESFVGAIVTQRDFLDSNSRLVGVDSNFRVGSTHSIALRAMGTDHRDEDALDTTGYFLDAMVRKTGRNLSYTAAMYALSPDFKTDVGFVRRTDQRFGFGNINYVWWPQSWLISWGPSMRYSRNHNFDGILEDEQVAASINFNFARNIRFSTNVDRDLERYQGINFRKTRIGAGGSANTSRLFSFGGGFNWGDEVYFDRANPFLGRESSLRMFISIRPASRFQSNININTSRFTDPRGLFIPGINEGEVDETGQVFSVNIVRALSTYQFSERLLFRNITEFNTFDETLGLNFLLTYRVNSGTAFYVGYDDHYRQREQFNDQEIFPGNGYQQTNRAIFTKFQYLFRF